MKISSAVAEPTTKTMSQQKWFNNDFHKGEIIPSFDK